MNDEDKTKDDLISERTMYKNEWDHQFELRKKAEEEWAWYRAAFIVATVAAAAFAALSITLTHTMTEFRDSANAAVAQANACKNHLGECREQNSALLASLHKCAVESTPCPEGQGCPPPPPGCTESGQLAQCSERLDTCERQLNWREQKLDFGEWYTQVQANANAKIAELRVQYLALVEEFKPLMDKATEMGLGPRVRDWINKPGAVELYLGLGERWAELDLAYFRMREVVQTTSHAAETTCYQNIQWSWDGILPDEREHDRLQQAAYLLTDGKYYVYLYEQKRAERNRQ